MGEEPSAKTIVEGQKQEQGRKEGGAENSLGDLKIQCFLILGSGDLEHYGLASSVGLAAASVIQIKSINT